MSDKIVAEEAINYSKTLKDLTAEVNEVCVELGWHKFTENDLKVLIILGISELKELSEDNNYRERLFKLTKGITEEGRILVPIRLRQSIEDGLLYLPNTKNQVYVNTGKFTIVDLDIMYADKSIEGQKTDWQSIRVFVKAAN